MAGNTTLEPLLEDFEPPWARSAIFWIEGVLTPGVSTCGLVGERGRIMMEGRRGEWEEGERREWGGYGVEGVVDDKFLHAMVNNYMSKYTMIVSTLRSFHVSVSQQKIL